MDVIQTQRLLIRPFTMDDVEEIHRILNTDLKFDDLSLEQHREWIRWSVMNYVQLEQLHQPPYGDRAVVLREPNRLIGSAGLVPSFGPFDQLPYFTANPMPNTHFRPEIGLYYAFDPAYHGHGYATEAARGLIDFAFSELNLAHIVATTEYTNERSQAVMRRLGMTLASNPFPDPFWFQVVGILENK